eukprot:jgi/Tetstr1/438901/TSEL_027409.t1
MHTALKNLWASVAIDAGAVLDWDRSGAGDLTLETSGLRPADRSRPSDLTLAGWGGAACDYMIDFACVSSTTPTWSNDPRRCIPGIAATEAEHAKLAAERASSAPVQGVHRYYPFVVEDRGRLGKSALTVVYIFAVLLVVRNFPGVQCCGRELCIKCTKTGGRCWNIGSHRRPSGVPSVGTVWSRISPEAGLPASISAAGTVDTALSEAQTEPPRDAKSNSSGAEGDRGSNGRRSPRAARSQISTAIGAVAADSCEKPAGSAAQPSASADGDSALSAAKPEAADGSYDGSIQGHSHGQPVPKMEYPSASGGEQGSIAGHAQAQITPENPLPPPPNPDFGADAQVEGVSIHSGGGGRPTPAISVLSHRHLSNDDMQAVWSHDEAHGGGAASNAVPAQASSHHTPQRVLACSSHDRDIRHGSQPRTHAYSSSAIVDPAAQPQMARIEGFLDHNPAPRPQVSSIYLQPPPGAPEVTHPKSLLIHDPIEQPQMASIEGWPGPLVVQDRVLPAADIDARQEEGGQEEEEAAEPANPATSVHATVVMDGTLSEGETDHSSMRQGIEGNMGSLEIDEQADREIAAPFAAANPQDMEPPVGIVPIPCEAGEPAPATDSRCASGGPADDPMEAVADEDVQMQQDGQAPVEEPNTSAAANAEQDAQDTAAAPMEMGSSHHGLQLPVHPATSVHATVMADGTQSDGDTDLSSLQQGGQPAVRNHSTLRQNTVSDGDQEPISLPVKSSDSGQAHVLGSMSAPQQRKPATGSTSRPLQGESFRENITPHASNGPGEDASNGHPSDGWKMDGVEHHVGEQHAKRHESATGMGAMLAANPLYPVASSREHSSQPVINQDNHAIDAPADDGNRPAP